LKWLIELAMIVVIAAASRQLGKVDAALAFQIAQLVAFRFRFLFLNFPIDRFGRSFW
jgi:hypothetical protein